MQQRAADGTGIHEEIGNRVRRIQGVDNVGLAGFAILARVRLLGKGVGSSHHLLLLGQQIFRHLGLQVFEGDAPGQLRAGTNVNSSHDELP